MILCVTGPMAAGKNLAQDILASKGFCVFDADKIIHGIVELKKEDIVREFSPDAEKRGIKLLKEDGTVDRRALGQIVFLSKENTARQENIVYPELNRQFDRLIEENLGKDIVINATVLYKVPLIKKTDCVLFVDAPCIIRLLRAKKRDGRTLKDILHRFKSQRNLFAKYRLANADTRRVWNIGTRHRLEKKIDEFLALRR